MNLEYDILVAGGGTAGTAAAIAAARRGHRVLLVEEQNCLGGISTSGGVGEWFASLAGLGDVFDTVRDAMSRTGAIYENHRSFNPETLKAVWQVLAEQAGVTILFHGSVGDANVDHGLVASVQLVSCSKRMTASAKQYIDATGEGDLCALAGAEFMQGDAEGHRVLHMTLVAWMYDTGIPQTPYLPDGFEPISGPDDLPGLGAGWTVSKGRVYMNATKVMGLDPTDPFHLSAAECEARRQLIRLVHYLQSNQFPTYALASSGAKIGIREGRRIVGDFVLTHDQVIDRTEPLSLNDGIAVATSQIDFHSLNKPGKSGWRQRVAPYSIPLRCLQPKGFSNLLVAGKCISTDQVVHSSCRMTPTCCAMGQSAGTVAAMAVERRCVDTRDVPVEDIRETLVTDGMQLDPKRHRAFAPHDTRLDRDDQVSGEIGSPFGGALASSALAYDKECTT